MLFVCEDNQFSAFTRTTTTTAGRGAHARAEAIGVRAASVDGNDVFAVYNATRELVAHIRRGRGPAFLYAPTYRLDGHTVFDTAPYRPSGELERRREDDPIALLEGRLRERGVSLAQLESICEEARLEMDRAMERARAAPSPVEADAYADVQTLGAPQ